MRRATITSLKKVTPENVAGLGVDRIAEILVEVAETRPDLKRRLRMELAAQQGPGHLLPEIDKRLGTIALSRGNVTWRQKPAFLRDLAALRALIGERLAALSDSAALERMWLFMALARPVLRRLQERDATVAAVFDQAAGDLGRLLASHDPLLAATALVDAVINDTSAWTDWLPHTLAALPKSIAEQGLRLMRERGGTSAAWLQCVRHFADAARDADAYRDTYDTQAQMRPGVAVELARRYLAAGEIRLAGEVLCTATPDISENVAPSPPSFEWETEWIEYLERSGEVDAAQTARWASFERTLDAGRARDFTRRLTGFDDVEAESRAFAIASAHRDFQRGLSFLMSWPALPEAAQMIQERPEDIRVDPLDAELWAAKLRRRHPASAHILLRKAAAAAFKRREYKTSDRLTQEADTIAV